MREQLADFHDSVMKSHAAEGTTRSKLDSERGYLAPFHQRVFLPTIDEDDPAAVASSSANQSFVGTERR